MNNNVHFCRCIQSQLPTTAPHMPRVYSRMVDNVQALIYQAGEGLCLYQDTWFSHCRRVYPVRHSYISQTLHLRASATEAAHSKQILDVIPILKLPVWAK